MSPADFSVSGKAAESDGSQRLRSLQGDLYPRLHNAVVAVILRAQRVDPPFVHVTCWSAHGLPVVGRQALVDAVRSPTISLLHLNNHTDQSFPAHGIPGLLLVVNYVSGTGCNYAVADALRDWVIISTEFIRFSGQGLAV